MHNAISAVKKIRGKKAWPNITYFDDSQFKNINKKILIVFFFF